MNDYMRRYSNNKALNYCRRHLWFSYILVILTFGVLFLMIGQVYLKNEYSKYLIEKSYESETFILGSISDNIAMVINDLIHFGSDVATNDKLYSTVLMYDKSGEKTALNNKNINELLYRFTRSSRWINSISIVSDEGLVSMYDKNKKKSGLWNYDNENILRILHESMKKRTHEEKILLYRWSYEPITHPEWNNIELFHIIFPLRGQEMSNDVDYSIIVSIEIQWLKDILNSVDESERNVAIGYITDANDNIVFHNDERWIGTSRKEYLDQNDYKNLSQTLEYFDFNINIAIDENKLIQYINEIYYKNVTLYIILIFMLLSTLLAIIKKSVMNPVNKVLSSIKEVKRGNLYEKIDVQGYNEIWVMAKEFNNMIDALHDMEKQIIVRHKEKIVALKRKRLAELEALESQINAHFICNTLGVINYQAIDAKNYMISNQIKKLSNILRYTLDQKTQNIFLYQEIAWLDQYLYLQKLRWGDKFDYKINFSIELGEYSCCKMIFQPFVENSIIHGFKGIDDGGVISIDLKILNQEFFEIRIMDNGCGMTKEKINSIMHNISNIKSGKRIGIGNVIARLKLYYGQNANIQIESEIDEGTTIILELPIAGIRSCEMDDTRSYEDYTS